MYTIDVKGENGGANMSIKTRIEEYYQSLTKKQKSVADFIRENMDMMSFITLKEMSRQIGVTEITILNTCQSLGYDNFNELKYECRKMISEGRKQELHENNEYFAGDVPSYELDDKEQLLKDIVDEEQALMREFVRLVDVREIYRVAEVILHYKKVILCGRGVSYLMAEYMATYLAEMNISGMAINSELNDSVYSALPSFDGTGLLIAFSFPDYYFMTDKLMEYAKNNGTQVILITDSAENEQIEYSNYHLIAPSMTRMFLNSLSAPMALLNILASALKIKKKEKGSSMERMEEFETLFKNR